MRGKNKIWMTIAAVFIASLTISMISVPKAFAYLNVAVINPLTGTGDFGPLVIGDTFDANIVVDEVYGLHAFEFELSWNPEILRLSAEVPVSEGPFLPSGGDTYFVKSIGVDQGSIEVADLLTTGGYSVDGMNGLLAIAHFKVIGGGSCMLALTAELYDADWNAMGATTTPGNYFSTVPYIVLKILVPVPTPTGDFVSVNGMGHYNALDESGNPATYITEPYTTMRPVLYPDNTGWVLPYENVSGTLFFGDNIFFDASESYVLDASGNPVSLPDSAFHYTIKAGGAETIKGNDVRYDSGVELPSGPAFVYNFPGSLSLVYSYYASYYLGWFELTLTVTYGGQTASLYTWIRIFRIAGDQIKMVNIPDKHVHKGDTMLIGAKTQNLIGTGRWGPFWLMEDSASGQIALGRMINSFIWSSAKLTITNAAGITKATLYTPAVYMTGTETPTSPVYATWTVPNDLPAGKYTVTAKAVYCGTGNGFGLTGSGTKTDWFEILP